MNNGIKLNEDGALLLLNKKDLIRLIGVISSMSYHTFISLNYEYDYEKKELSVNFYKMNHEESKAELHYGMLFKNLSSSHKSLDKKIEENKL